MKNFTILAAALALAGMGCDSSSSGGGGTAGTAGSGGSGGDAGSQAVTIQFAAVVGEDMFDCGETYDNLGTPPSSIQLDDFRFYVQSIELKNSDGDYVAVTLNTNNWQVEDIALLDFEDCSELGNTEMNSVVMGTVPEGTYDGLRFKMGLPFELNHANPSIAPTPLNLTAMHWNWQGGYKFLRIDSGNIMTTPTNWRMHLGSTGCDGDVEMGGTTMCSNPNRVDVDFEAFDPAENVVVADFAALVDGADLATNQEGTPFGCMAGPMDSDCAPLFDSLGLSFAGSEPDTQTFFSAE